MIGLIVCTEWSIVLSVNQNCYSGDSPLCNVICVEKEKLEKLFYFSASQFLM